MPTLIAHRGFAGEHPENTTGAFEAAAADADAVELDVRRCRTGELVVFHDRWLGRLTGLSGPVSWRSYDRLQETTVLDSDQSIPTLSEALAAIPEDVGINIELKSTAIADDVIACCADAPNDILVSAFDESALRTIDQLADDVATAFLFKTDTSRVLSKAIELGCTAIHPQYDCCFESDLIDRAHDRGLAVNAWTVTDRSTAQRLRSLGVDGIIADYSSVLHPREPGEPTVKTDH